jgi:DNA-binding GntR family transcriptional regulator
LFNNPTRGQENYLTIDRADLLYGDGVQTSPGPVDADPLVALAAARDRITAASTADRVADVLRSEVAEGRLRSGTRLPEQSLCDALAVSRNTVREALGQLVAERVLARVPHRGVVVATPGVSTVRDVYQARRVLEPGALRLAHPGPAGAGALRAAVTEGERAAAAADGDGVGTANQHFHRAVVALAGSPRLDQQMALLLAEMRLVFHRVSGAGDFHLPYLSGNEAVCARLEAGDPPGAADLLTDYLHRAEADLLAALPPD